jgi:hypothetical protein
VGWGRSTARWNPGGSNPLLIALGLLFVLESLLPGPSPLVGVAYIIVLLGSAWAVGRDRRQIVFSLSLLGAAVAVRILYQLSPGWLTLLLNHLGTIVFLGYAAASIFRRAVAAPGRLGEERIRGAICVYLMMGVLGGAVASSIAAFQPGAFRFPDPGGAAPGSEPSAYLYFSFVTLATLGYGDIIPVTPVARTFSWMLAVAGQMYVAIVVARLVSLAVAPSQEKES